MSKPIAVELHAHDPRWAEMAGLESVRLARVLDDNLIRVEHIGSTAIPGIVAKPIIDLMPLMRSLNELDAAADSIRALGYVWHGELGIPDRRYCSFGDAQTGRRVYQLHFFQQDSAHVERHLAFREYLRSHPADAKAYEAEKIKAAGLEPNNSHAYNDLKNPWIRACETRALHWRRSQSGTTDGIS